MRYITTPCDMALACHGIHLQDAVEMKECRKIFEHNIRRCSIIVNLIDEESHTGKKMKKVLSSETIGVIRCFNYNPSTKNLASVLSLIKRDRELVSPDINAIRLCKLIVNDPSESNCSHVKKTLKWSDYDIEDFFDVYNSLSLSLKG